MNLITNFLLAEQQIKMLSVSKRFLSSTKFTTLNNGIIIATEAAKSNHSSIGFFYNAGSRSEHLNSNGIAALTNNLIASTIKDVNVSTVNSKEINGIIARSSNDDLTTTSKSIIESVQKFLQSTESALGSEANKTFNQAKSSLLSQANSVESNPASKVLSHLSATAFQGYSLALPCLGNSSSIPDLQFDDSDRLLKKHLVGSNIVIAASGNFNHDSFVDSIESNLNFIPQGLKPITKHSSFLGSEVRMRDDTLNKAYVSIAVEGESLSSPAYYVAKVAAAIIGNYDSNSILSKFTSPKLASIVSEYNIVDKYSHFSKSYSDTGLWGFNSEISNINSIDEFTHFTIKQWNRLSISVSNSDVLRAKNQIKTQLLNDLNSPTSIINDIAKSVLSIGYRNSINESLEKIDSITSKEIQQWAKVALWDRDIVISATGQIEGLLDYGRHRNDMAMMRW